MQFNDCLMNLTSSCNAIGIHHAEMNWVWPGPQVASKSPFWRAMLQKKIHRGQVGRGAAVLSNTCRRAADRDYKRAKAHVALFEEQLRNTRHEVAAYGRKAEEGTFTPEELMSIHAEARVALERSATVLELGAPPERIASELEALVQATRPLVEAHQGWVTSRSA
ncbi:MAG: hypothetical protein U0Q08_11175 [Dermatophilaceae bacterium]